MIPPKISVSQYADTIKGQTAIRILNKYKELKQKPYWGNHFWSRSYCVETVDLDREMIRKYNKYQEEKGRKEQQQLFLCFVWDQLILSPLGGRTIDPLPGVILKPALWTRIITSRASISPAESQQTQTS